VGDTNLVIPNISAISSLLVFSQTGSSKDSRCPLKPLIANFYCVDSTTIMVVNTGSASPSLASLAHPFTVWEILIRVPNQWHKCGHEPTSAGFCGIHGASAESQNNFI
jgi:hypothetical protein